MTQTVGLFLNTSNAWPGYTLMAPMHHTNTYLINNAGQVVHMWTSTYEPGRSAYLMTNGHMFRAGMVKQGGPSTGGGEGGRIEEYDWDGNLVWAIDHFSPTYIHHHDFKVLPNGNVLMLVAEKKLSPKSSPRASTRICWTPVFSRRVTCCLIAWTPSPSSLPRSEDRPRRSGSLSIGVANATLMDELAHPVPVPRGSGRLAGPPHEQRLALDVVQRHRAPHPRIARLLAVVPHHEDVALGHHVVARELAALQSVGLAVPSEGAEERRARPLGLAFATGPGPGWWVPLPAESDAARAVLDDFRPILQDERVTKPATISSGSWLFCSVRACDSGGHRLT